MGTGLGCVLVFPDQVEPLLAGLLVHLKEVGTLVVVEFFKRDPAVSAVLYAPLLVVPRTVVVCAGCWDRARALGC